MLFKKSTITASILVSPFLSVAGQTHEADTLTVEHARAIVTPLYESLNEPSKKDVLALLSQATVESYRSCSTNEDCLNRTQLAALFKSLGQNIPDLHWRIVDIFTSATASSFAVKRASAISS